ncbi:MAG: hypothetical protein AAGA65_22770, partial [Actinomycetota bacterium]
MFRGRSDGKDGGAKRRGSERQKSSGDRARQSSARASARQAKRQAEDTGPGARSRDGRPADPR